MRELAQHVTDLLENATRAGARRVEIELVVQPESEWLTVRVTDDGCGMSSEVVERVTDPFFTSRTCRRVGLGLPLLAASCERSGGDLRIESSPGRGTTVEASFRLSNIDTPPVGDLRSTLMCAIVGHPEVAIRFRYAVGDRGFELDSAAIREELGSVPLTTPSVLGWLERYVSEGLSEVGALTAPKEESYA